MDTEQKILSNQLMRNNARFRVLAEIAKSFAMASIDYHELLNRVAFSAADLIGDGCIVTLMDDDGMLSTKTSAHRDPELDSAYKENIKSVRISAQEGKNISAQVVRSGEPVFGSVTQKKSQLKLMMR